MSQGPAKGKDLLEIEDGRAGRMVGEAGRTDFYTRDKNTEILQHISDRLDQLVELLASAFGG